MSSILKKIYNDISKDIQYSEDNQREIIQKIKISYENIEKSKRKILFEDQELELPWNKISKDEKFQKIKNYLKKNNIEGPVNSYSFKNIKYDIKKKTIASLKCIKK